MGGIVRGIKAKVLGRLLPMTSQDQRRVIARTMKVGLRMVSLIHY
jgi:hypothetical protein